MINKKIILACLTGALMVSANFAYAEEEQPQAKNVHVTLSLKGWNESWSTWNWVGNLGAYGPGTLINSADSSMALIGGVTVRIKDFFMSGNYAPQSSFEFTDITKTYKRSENDLNFGFYVNPQVAFSLGRKVVELTYNPNAVWTHTFITLGVNGSSRIGDSNFFMYENGAMSLTGTTDVTFTTTGVKGTPTYRSLEAGFGFAANPKLTFTAGYKFQQVELPLTFGTLTENTRDTTTGFIFGAALTF